MIIISLLESWRLEETCCHSNYREKPSANTDVKNTKGVNNNNKRYQTGKRQAIMECMVSGSRCSPPFTTD